jgi:hypothetical protein
MLMGVPPVRVLVGTCLIVFSMHFFISGPSLAQTASTQDQTPPKTVVPTDVVPTKIVVGPPLVHIAQTVSIQSVSPNPVNPGQALLVALSSTGSPTGCALTLVPFGQGNIPSIVSLAQPPPMEARIPIPAALPLGYYAIQVNCDPVMATVTNPVGGGTIQMPQAVAATKTILIGGLPSISNIGPNPAVMGNTVTVTGMDFGQTQGQSYIFMNGGYGGAGLPSST